MSTSTADKSNKRLNIMPKVAWLWGLVLVALDKIGSKKKEGKGEIPKTNAVYRILGSKTLLLIVGVLMAFASFAVANVLMKSVGIVFEFLFLSEGKGIQDFEFPFEMAWLYQAQTDHAINWTVYGVTAVLSSIGYVRFCYKMRSSYGTIVKNQHGDRDFVLEKELKKQYRRVPDKEKSFKGKGGVPISHSGSAINAPYKYMKSRNHKWSKNLPYNSEKWFIDDSAVNNIILGTTRSGKGETFVFPTIDIYSRAEQKASIIANDPKGELAAASKETLEARGYDVHVLNLLDPENSMSYNPLQLVKEAYKKEDYATAELLAKTFSFSLYNNPNSKDPFFEKSAMALCNALILAVASDSKKRGKEEIITPYTIANMLSTLGGDVEEDSETSALDKYFQSRPTDDPARMQYATVEFSKNNTRAAVMAVTMEKLQTFTNTSIAKMTAKNSLNLEELGFGDKPVALFMVTPDYDESLHPIASIMVRQITFCLSKRASAEANGKCYREVIFLLDEFGNMPAIEGMENIITVCLGRNIRFNLVIQSYAQIRNKYGADGQQTIMGNCGNHIYILTNDLDTAEHFSKLLGTRTIVDASRSGGTLSLDKNKNESVKERSLLMPAELMELGVNESVVIRVIKRQDTNMRKIESKPIYNRNNTELMPRWMFLTEDFNTDNSVQDLRIDTIHRNVNLKDLVFDGTGKRDRLNLAHAELGKKYMQTIESIVTGAEESKNEVFAKYVTKKQGELTVSQFVSLLIDATQQRYISPNIAQSILTMDMSDYYEEEEIEKFCLMAIQSKESKKIVSASENQAAPIAQQEERPVEKAQTEELQEAKKPVEEVKNEELETNHTNEEETIETEQGSETPEEAQTEEDKWMKELHG